MSIKSAFEEDDLKFDGHESSDFPQMSEHLRDSNILQSRKTYGRKKNSGSLSVCRENSGSFSTTVEDWWAEKNLESAASITSSSYSKNNYEKEVDSKFCLFSDEVTDNYVSGSADSPKDGISSILGTVSSGSNYQRTRKNLKNQINNEQNNSEEIFKSSVHEKNSNFISDANELKSANDFLNPNQATFSVKQSSLLSENSQANHTRINKSDGSANELPQKSTVQMGKPVGFLGFGKANFFENPLINQSMFSLIDLVKKFSVRNNETCAKNTPTSKRIEEVCEFAPLKKESVANSASSSKINSFDKKTLKSTVSIRKSSKNVILKSDVINANKLGVKKGGVKTPSKSIQKRNIRSFDKIEKSVDMIGCVRNTDTPREIGAKIPSKAVQWENIKRSIKVLTKYVSKHKFVENNVKATVKSSVTRKTSNLLTDAPMKRGAKIPSKAVQSKNIKRSIKLLTKYVSKNKFVENNVKAKVKSSITCTTSNLHLVRNGTTGKIQSDRDEKQIEKLPFVHSNEKAIQKQFLDNIPVIFAPIPPFSQETIPLCIRSVNTSVAYDHSIQNGNQAVSHGNFEDMAIPEPSTLSNNHSIQNDNQAVSHGNFEDMAIPGPSTLNNNHSIQNDNMAVSHGDFEDLAISGPSTLSNNHSIENDNQAVSHGNFEDLAIPGPSTLSNIHCIQNDNQAVSRGNFEDLAIPGPSTLSNNHSSRDATNFLENPVYHEQEMRTGSFMSLGVFFEQTANDYFQRTENMCMLRKAEMARMIFSSHPSLSNITVSQFCNFPRITAVFSDYLNDCVGVPLNYHDFNEGYDFPENFETENMLSVVKDFVHSIIFYIIPKYGPKPSDVSYLQIINAAVSKMSIRENAIVTRVFGKKSSSEKIKLDDMLSKFDFVAMLVIFDEYKRRQITSNMKN
ncbi:uncharacterized protein LOC129960883 [Argiope bruennichi]|uniref:uncharacterized protein LOC129960883 n=1 Tax=Argiope bruennichi TaxID=94029 RepID=UPI00249586DA|nr:uncharacterized protein LOC129960883 [Argiope bruennichi]